LKECRSVRGNDDLSKQTALGKNALRSSEKLQRRSETAETLRSLSREENQDAQKNSEEPRRPRHLGVLVRDRFSDDLGHVVDQSKRDFSGGHSKNCLQKNLG